MYLKKPRYGDILRYEMFVRSKIYHVFVSFIIMLVLALTKIKLHFRKENGRIILEHRPYKTCRVTVKRAKVEDSGQWEFGMNFKTFLYNVDVRPNGNKNE